MVFNVVQWPTQKTLQVIWDALHDYGRTKWQWALSLLDLEKAPDVAYQDVLNEFDLILGGQMPYCDLEQLSYHLKG